MSLLIKNNNNKKSLSSLSTTIAKTTKTTFAASALVGSSSTKRSKEAATIILHKNPTIKPTSTTRTRNPKSSLSSAATTLLSPSIEEATLNVDAVSSSLISSTSLTEISLMEQQQQQQQPSSEVVESGAVGRKVFRTMPSFKIMSYQNFIALLTVLVCGLVTVNGLKCYMCGQYNEGVGSITPCLNYSEQYAHLYLKECSKKSEKYCVKYVSELSIVRDCATECAEKEIWETQTYCCTEDGCNGSSTIEASAVFVMLPLFMYIVNEIMNIIKQQSR